MENEALLNRILEKLETLEKGQQDFKAKMNDFRQETQEGIKNLNEKLDLLTKQTSNAVVENHSNELKFLSSKVQQLEKDIYKLKHS
ncbi:hypothetical protein [Lentibacillus amyloliquefaciens]|uniref:Uncharacterized protein n=1 Tax=Lentibacillus amyloliquefaciens TaxID=1472767 RepID=A0A0U4F8X0_9BACI|nr:hypothetical protein [Lentibacillus amyloliquefaciens]ALX50038.1 hypothetical protein AOX59_16500 [Lentibacillus amyloliquefaciens]